MNILITDDERLVRVNLMSMLEELYPGEHHIDEARNGNEMSYMVLNKFYDVVFLDINMPQKNGLDALELCHQKSLETEWCILTGYAEFEYAKRAISLGVKGYLLKPLDIDELKNLMDEIISKKRENILQKHQLFENEMNQAFALADTTGILKKMPSKKDVKYSCYLFFLDMLENNRRQELYARLYKEISEYISKHLDINEQYALFFLQTSELCLVIEGKENRYLHAYLERHSSLYKDYASVTAISSEALSFEELYMNKQVILGISALRILEKNCTTISLEELSKQENLMERKFFCEKLEMLTAEYVTGNYNMANELLHEMEWDERMNDIFKQIDRKLLFSYLTVVWKENFAEDNYIGLLKHFKGILERDKRAENEEQGDVISQIKEYVLSNYMDDVTIAEMGRRFGISPSYISRIFREKTGEKYIDFVTSVRMDNAMRILRTEPMLSVKMVSERVGYVSEKHFSKTFKKYFGSLPSQINCTEL